MRALYDPLLPLPDREHEQRRNYNMTNSMLTSSEALERVAARPDGA